ncbi:MAG: hypothetical protein K1X36_04615 [Pyrinomonadaceae bacterium]|nr:hypothetical protein [Pyrinomonadaceae bacterium]
MHRLVTAFVLAFVLSFGVLAQSTIIPIVELRGGGLLGGVRNQKWIEPSIVFESLNVDSKVKLIGFGGLEPSSSIGLKRGPVEDVCQDFYRMELDLEPRDGVAIGAAAGWNPVPRIPKELSPKSAALRNAAAALLRTKGILRSKVIVTGAYSVDLDGNGKIETILSATYSKRGFNEGSSVGDYSFVMIQSSVGGKVSNRLVDGEFIRHSSEFGAPNQYEVQAIADLNGDGRMEIVVYSQYYEGAGTAAFEVEGGHPKHIKALTIGCGV